MLILSGANHEPNGIHTIKILELLTICSKFILINKKSVQPSWRLLNNSF